MIRVVEKALNILELLSSDTSKAFSLSEIAEALAMDKGTCSNIMKTLRLRGYVDQSVPRKGYKMGYMIYRLSDPFVNNDELTRKSIDELDLLGARLNEAVLLSVLRQDKRVVLYGTMPDQELAVRTSREVPVYRSNTGRLILSYYSDEDLIRFVRRYGLPKPGDWEGVESLEDLLREFRKAREQGWYMDKNRNLIVGLSVPVWKASKVVAGLGVYLPEVRYKPERKVAIITALKKTADHLRIKFNSENL